MSLKTKVASVPYLVWMVIFIILPLLFVIYYAFTDSSGHFTFENISDAGRQYLDAFAQSIWLALIATVICLVLALPLAYMISRMRGVRQSVMIMLIMLPMWMNFMLRTYAWMALLSKDGIIDKILTFIGFESVPLINTQGAVVLGMVYNYLPFMILPLYSVMTKIDNSIIHAAQDLGASMWNVTSRVILPLSVPGITTGITMVFVPSISTFVISQMLGGGKTMLVGDVIDLHLKGPAYNPNMGSAMALVLMVIVLLCMSVANQFDDEEMEGMLI